MWHLALGIFLVMHVTSINADLSGQYGEIAALAATAAAVLAINIYIYMYINSLYMIHIDVVKKIMGFPVTHFPKLNPLQ